MKIYCNNNLKRSLWLCLFFLSIAGITNSYATVSLFLTVYKQGEGTGSPQNICINPGSGYDYLINIQRTSTSDNVNGTLYIKFRGSNNNVTTLNTVTTVNEQFFSNDPYNYVSARSSIQLSNGPSNMNNGEIFATFELSGGTSYTSLQSYLTAANYVTVSPASASINSQSSATLTASGTVSGSTFAWTPSKALNTTTGSTVVASPGVTTTYTVTATSSAGCVGSKTVTVTVTGPCCVPTKTFTNQTITTDNASDNITASGSSSIASGSTVVLTAGNYIQLNPDVLINSASSSVFEAKIAPCTYNACRTGAMEESNDFKQISTLTSLSLYQEIMVYPNPSSGVFTISSDHYIETVEVINSQGKVILKSNSLQIDLSDQPDGIYFIAAFSDGKKDVKKIFKNR